MLTISRRWIPQLSLGSRLNGPYYFPNTFKVRTWSSLPGHYFVMGDNRTNSMDSRYWGFVPRETFWGVPFVLLVHCYTPIRSEDIPLGEQAGIKPA